ncbi:hypothetical protein AB9K34_06085 [Sedimentitalea sp. XS_ASV28]|uniref:hypothetical protein n=1 Tax=Sedimentitalea sp. XS_ASV28 TaxID=3241296 RepID=UPI0035125D03
MTMTYQPAKELDYIRAELVRLKAREKSLRAILTARPGPHGIGDDATERQLRDAFRQPGLFARRAS